MAEKVETKQKKLCKMVEKKVHIKKPEKYLKNLLPPDFICEKCGLPTKEEGLVCKGVKRD
jgi:hypothetical protein